MISRATRSYADEEILEALEPEVRAWFTQTLGSFTPPQTYAVREIHAGKNVLISSPTGSGKTLSAFLAVLNELSALSKRGALEDRVYCIYVSPLKALNNDIERNLQAPLAGIRAAFEAAGAPAPDIRVGVRTGDTPPSERQAMTRKPPHILITTPESLAICLAAPKFGEHLRGARWVIVDELHALAENKRGTHLSLSLERLESSSLNSITRIGLSATVAPLDEMARFLVGDDEARDCLVVDVQYLKFTDLEVLSPVDDLVYTPPGEFSDRLYDLLDRLIETHRTTLVFTNTRSGTERVVLHLKQRFGRKYAQLGEPAPGAPDAEQAPAAPPEALPSPDAEGTTVNDLSFVAAHHGSLSRETRFDVESALKQGSLKCVVCSTSLELGIDIGYVDLVVLLGSPKGVARALQRVGRSGHKLNAVSKGRIVALDRDDLVESLVLAKCALEKKLDEVVIPRQPLDVLCQHIIGMAIAGVWKIDDAYALTRRAYAYRDLAYDDFLACVRYLAGHHAQLQERRVYAKIWLDEAEGTFGRRGKMIRAIYSMNVGTIPDTSLAKVFQGERYVGQVEEDFLENIRPGDVFVLGGHTWQFNHARGMKAHVSPAMGRRPTVPAWYSEQLPLSRGLAAQVQRLRDELARRIESGEPRADTLAFLRMEYHANAPAARAVYNYFAEQARFAFIPTSTRLLVEEFVDDDLRRDYVFHTLVGRRANEALARAFAKSLSEQKGVNVRLQVADNGFLLALPRSCVLTVGDVKGLFFADVAEGLRRALDNSEILKRRFRHVATRAFLLLRNYGGRSQTVGRQQVNSFILFHILRRMDPDFPILKEVYREIFEEAFDVSSAEDLCFRVLSKQVNVEVVRGRKAPTPFAHALVAMGGEDTVVMEDRKRMVRDLHERVMEILAADEAQ